MSALDSASSTSGRLMKLLIWIKGEFLLAEIEDKVSQAFSIVGGVK
jgi:hypothetical protein